LQLGRYVKTLIFELFSEAKPIHTGDLLRRGYVKIANASVMFTGGWENTSPSLRLD
jgi:hypothetical protein